MAGYGTPSSALGTHDAGPATIGIAAASWHTEIMDALLDGARRAAADAGAAPVADDRHRHAAETDD